MLTRLYIVLLLIVALTFTQSCDKIDSGAGSNESNADRRALVELYKSTYGELWVSSTNWNSSRPISQWYGVTVDPITGRVRQLNLSNNNLSGELPSSIATLDSLQYINLTGNSIGGDIPASLGSMVALKKLWLADNVFSGNIPESLSMLEDLSLRVNNNRLSGQIPEVIISHPNWDSWNPDKYIIPQRKGYVLTTYDPESLSDDGKVVKLWEHTEGAGISLIITGDGFTARDIEDGSFESLMQATSKAIFEIEPYKSFKHLFDLYYVVAISNHSNFNGSTIFGTEFGEGTLIEGDDEKVFEYAKKTKIDISNATIMVLVKSTRYAGTCYMYSIDDAMGDWMIGPTISYIPLCDTPHRFEGVLYHEALGHGFAKLDDEYVYEKSGSFPKSEEDKYVFNWKLGWFRNVDIESDTSKVRWAHFLRDQRYKDDKLSVYEGAGTYESGLYRPTENSIMNENVGVFNAPSREAIYYRIGKLAYGASWQYRYEDFVKYDIINIGVSNNNVDLTKSHREQPRLHPPIIKVYR